MGTDPDTSLAGSTLGKYQLLEKIGSGSMADVYLANAPFIDRQVAVKVAKPLSADDEDSDELSQRVFFNEAQAAGMLKHPHITAIYDAGADAGYNYIVMEYVEDGRSLEDFTVANQLLPIDFVADIVYQAALALDYAHQNGVVHRDIKPRNILLTADSKVKISDFGIALVAGPEGGQLTENAGSPLYMSPEQILGETVGSQTDLFSLGVVAYQLLTGKHPFAESNLEAIQHRTLHSKPTPAQEYRAEVPDVFERILKRALTKDLKHRYRSGADLAGDVSLIHEFVSASAQVPQDEKFRLCRDLEFFREFSDAEIWEILNAAEWESKAAGERIINEGEQESCFYLVVDGEVEVRKGEQKLMTLVAGDCFGEMGMISGRARIASIVANSDMIMMRIKDSVIERTSINSQLKIQRQFMDALVERLEIATERIASLSDTNSEQDQN